MFDFASYLYNLTGEPWTFHELSGGNANYVVRATRLFVPLNEGPRIEYERTALSDALRAHRSIVLKQAPPHFAKFPDVQFSQRRQDVEATALEHFSTQGPLLDVLRTHASIHIPTLLHHDRSQHVLVQSDIGSHPSLDAFLSSPATTEANASSAGQILGSFLAGLHHAYDDDSSSHPNLLQAFANDDGEKVMEGVIANATNFMRDAGVDDWGILGARALEHWKSRRRTAFSQGDIWFGTILVDGGSGDGAPVVKICDWEFAGLNERAADIAQLGAYLHLSSLSPLTSTHTHRTLHAFTTSLYKAYFSIPSPDDPRFHRSWMIMHGWELVNAAAWRHELWCACPGVGVKCEHVAGMVREGAKVLRAASDKDEGGGHDWEALHGVPWFANLGKEGGSAL